MCVIIEKNAGASVPFEHLLAGAHRNPDGYGVAVADRGKLELVNRVGPKPKEAAEDVAKVLEEAKELPAYVHFRYRTVGDVNLANTQPIPIIEQGSAFGDLGMILMHNGTLNETKKGGLSDSNVFANRIVKPLVHRIAAFGGYEKVLEDPLLAEILYDYAGWSRFVLFDSNAKSIVINRISGSEQEYGWASNDYSINPTNIPSEKKFYSVHRSAPFDNDDDDGGTDQHADLVARINANKGKKKSHFESAKPSYRQTVKECTGLALSDFKHLDEDQMRELVEEEPDFATLLLLDLTYELYSRESELNKAVA